VCSWSRTQSHDLPDGCVLQYHLATTTCQQCGIHQLSTTPTTYWMRCILMKHHGKFPIMPLLLRLLRTVFCRPSWNVRLMRASPTLPLRNMTTPTAPNFFLLLLASMYLVLYMEIKTLGTACNKTALLFFVDFEGHSYNYLLCEFKSVFSFNVRTVFTYSILHYIHFTPACFTWQCHLQGVNTRPKVIYSKMDYICEFHNLQYILLLIPVCVWKKCVNFLMYCVHYV